MCLLRLPLLLFIIIFSNASFGQSSSNSIHSIGIGYGFGLNDAELETGYGVIFSIGYNKTVGEKQRLRLNPVLLTGNFSGELMLDVRKQYYRVSSYGYNMHYDLIRYKSVAFVVSAGGAANYSRGLLGSGGAEEVYYKKSSYLYAFSLVGNASAAIRYNSPKRRIAWEFRPLNFQVGSRDYVLFFSAIYLDVKLDWKKE